MSILSAYPKIVHLGKLPALYDGIVEVTEKVDGSQVGFGLDTAGELVIRSKGQQLYPPIEGMFAQFAASIAARRDRIVEHLQPGEAVYGEYLQSPRHNTLTYESVPLGNIALYGWQMKTFEEGHQWADHGALASLAASLDLDVVPLLAHIDLGELSFPGSAEHLHSEVKVLMDRESYLGGPKIEGVVAKNYGQLVTINGKLQPAFSKFVSAEFKEKHNEDWTPGKDALTVYFEGLRSEARWLKAIQRLKESGEYQGAPQDIGKIMNLVRGDVLDEEQEQIGRDLFDHFKGQVQRMATRGLPEWYKSEYLLKEAVSV